MASTRLLSAYNDHRAFPFFDIIRVSTVEHRFPTKVCNMKQFKRPLFLVSILISAASMLGATASAQPKISVAGVQVIREISGERGNVPQPFNAGQSGTGLALLIEVEDGKIIEFDMDASELNGFIDSTKTNLLSDGPGKFGRSDGFDLFPRISQDGKMAVISVFGSQLPASGATKIGAKGTIVTKIGKATEDFKSEPIELVKDIEFSVGDVDLKIKETDKSRKGGGFSFGPAKANKEKPEGLFVSFQSNSEAMGNVSAIRFLDEDGNELKAPSGGSGKFGFGKQNTYTRDFNFEEKPAGKVVVVLSVWSDLQTVKIPFAVTTGLGVQ